MIRSVVIDDELKSREVIKTLLEHFCPEVEVIAEAGNIKDSVQIITDFKPDLAFLDITLKEGDSFQILKQLPKIDFDIIFVTAYDEYSVRALKFSGITCLFKPLDIEELQHAVKAVSKRSTDMGLAYEMVDGILKSKFTRIPIITTSGLQFTDISEITYFQQEAEFVTVHFRKGETVKSSRDLSAFAEVIMSNSFLKLGNRIMINTAHLDAVPVLKSTLKFKNGDVLDLERRELTQFKEMI